MPAQNLSIKLHNNFNKATSLIALNPEIEPQVNEIVPITYDSYFYAVTDRFSSIKNMNVERVQSTTDFQNPNINNLIELCQNNEADYILISKIKFFKVGLAKYVFSSQVIVSLKVYDQQGNLVAEENFDTFKKNARMFGSAENSIKIGTDGALKRILKSIRKLKNN